MKRILLHTCCGPCSTYTVKRLREELLAVTGFWCNPNIHPFTEHRRRLENLERFAQIVQMPLIVEEGYDIIDYLRAVAGYEREGERCLICYRLRLERTAQVASMKGFDYFGTTLLISPYQQHDSLKQIGEDMASLYGVPFYYEDYRSGFKESRNLSRELDLYRQQYCGCVFSEWERFRDKPPRRETKMTGK
ncbi:MAG: epoxyqueuosine reductase QueH [Dehalococcoidia bacterium]|nr:epoxyqueuosine reductase QueH [Dehalococcoidia bacterium]